MAKPPDITWRGAQLKGLHPDQLRCISSDTDSPMTAPHERQIARARQTIVDYILMAQNLRKSTLDTALTFFAERCAQNSLPRHVVKAVVLVHGHPSRIAAMNLPDTTLRRWVRLYQMGGGTTVALAPLPPKAGHANLDRPPLRVIT